MTLEQLVWVIVLLLVALSIVAINDRTKHAPNNPKKVSALGLLIGMVVTAGTITLRNAYGRDVPNLKWLVPLFFVGIVLLAVVFVLRKVIWLYLRSALSGQFPRVMRRNANGQLEIKCPRCSCSVTVTEGRMGETAFKCPHCGEKYTWVSEIKS